MTRQVTVSIRQNINVDVDIADEIVWLNQEGVRTEGSCSAHGEARATALITPSSVQKARELGYTPQHIERLGLFEINLGAGVIEAPVGFEQVTEQSYDDCAFRAGLVKGHKVDTLYFGIEGRGRAALTVLLRTDEALALVWVLSGALWSEAIAATIAGECD